MDQYVSIDINVPKLIEWLVSRRHCQKDWNQDVAKIRAKINSALEDMPEHKGIVTLLKGSYLNYFHCLKIVEILQETEADSKNIFGRYSSKRMKDWQEIVSHYQKNNVYLAEASDLLINMTRYDIPNLKKQITKQQQLENEMKKKEVEAQKTGVGLNNELTNLLKELGLSRKESNYKSGLLETANGLDGTHKRITGLTKNLVPVMEHYKRLAAVTQPHAVINLAPVDYLAEKGNTTMYEYLKGEKPTNVILPVIHTQQQETSAGYDVIDWGTPIESDKIEIELVGAGVEAVDQLTIADDKTVAKGDMALTILDNATERANFMNSLLELKAFLKLRLFESDSEGSFDTVAESAASLEKMLAAVTEIIQLINNPTTQHQYFITHFPRYLEDILKRISQKELAIERANAVVEVSKERAKEAAAEYVSLSAKVKEITQKCTNLQNQITEEISKKYSGRDVYLIGGV